MLLSVFRLAYGDTIYLAGGAVRDYVLGNTINDYDLYLRSKDPIKDIDELKILGRRMGFTITMKVCVEYGVFAVTLEKAGLTIQVMNTDLCMEDLLKSFPANCTRLYLDDEGNIVKSEDFKEFEETREIKWDFSYSGGTEETQAIYRAKLEAREWKAIQRDIQ